MLEVAYFSMIFACWGANNVWCIKGMGVGCYGWFLCLLVGLQFRCTIPMCALTICIVILCLVHRICWTMVVISSLSRWLVGIRVADVIVSEVHVVEVVN